MKYFLFLLLIASPYFLYSQEIKSNTIDGFTNERTIETNIVTLRQGFTNGLGVSLTAIDKSFYLNIIGYGKGSNKIKNEDSVWFVTDNGIIVKYNNPIEVENSESSYNNMYIQHYYLQITDLETLIKNPIAFVRIVNAFGNTDVPISKKNGKNFSKLCEIFLKEISK